jgi:anoctamin-10
MLTIQIAKTEPAEQFKKLIRALANAGLQTEVRKGDESSLLVFVRAADEKIFGDMVYRSRSDTQG